MGRCVIVCDLLLLGLTFQGGVQRLQQTEGTEPILTTCEKALAGEAAWALVVELRGAGYGAAVVQAAFVFGCCLSEQHLGVPLPLLHATLVLLFSGKWAFQAATCHQRAYVAKLCSSEPTAMHSCSALLSWLGDPVHWPASLTEGGLFF